MSSFDKEYSPWDICPLSVDKLAADFAEFLDSAEEAIKSIKNQSEDQSLYNWYLGSQEYQLERDYVLTRNRSGCGFWDGDWDIDVGKLLTKLSQAKPEIELYTHDGTVYFY